ncbi:TetR/AcrR family transcriptional regulator [Paraburkholderia sediminicola]|uniref:TetR/AcrR family transcriptional regulator n=1 Tax=Paraburkholderia sediminicola TaxID=458836 RepID=UPI0038BA21D7
MMPWHEKHKQETRARIIAVAARAIRARGPSGVSVAEIMKEAGLTHGGFYAHFASKDELLAEAITRATAETLQFLEKTATDAAGQMPGLADIADAYLGTLHCEHPERGCVLAACGSELARADDATRNALHENVRTYLTWLQQHGDDAAGGKAERQIIGALATMVGGMILARAAGDPAEARKVLTAVRGFLHDEVSERDDDAQA